MKMTDLTNQQAAMAANFVLKILKSDLVDFTYQYGGKAIKACKLVTILVAEDASHYCMGNVRMQKGNRIEMQQFADKYKKGTVWQVKKIRLIDDKPQWINTNCKIVIDMRGSSFSRVLQFPTMPEVPLPQTKINDILQLTRPQRFDIMAIVTEIIDQRRSGAGQIIADVRLRDGSTDDNGGKASLPLTVFFRSDQEYEDLKACVAKVPLVIQCLQGNKREGKLHVTTVKDTTFWQQGAGPLCEEMAASATELCDELNVSDVADLTSFIPNEAVDYASGPAILTCGRLMCRTDAFRADLLGEDSEQVYQMNYVFVHPPKAGESILTKNSERLWTQATCMDATKTVVLAFRQQAMLSLAGLQPDDKDTYIEQCNANEINYPIMSSLRIRVKRQRTPVAEDSTSASASPDADQDLSIMVVEAEPQSFGAKQQPNESLQTMYDLLNTYPSGGDRLTICKLDDLSASPWYNMICANKGPIDKALVLVQSSQKSVAKALAAGFHVQTNGVADALQEGSDAKYKTVAFCAVEQSLTFTMPAAKKDGPPTLALAIVSKVNASDDESHRLKILVEKVSVIRQEEVDGATEAFRKLMNLPPPITSTEPNSADWAPSPAWKERKCRKMGNYPSLT